MGREQNFGVDCSEVPPAAEAPGCSSSVGAAAAAAAVVVVVIRAI
jgi:hypothetical protein